METMLINATEKEEVRVALTRQGQLFDLDIERSGGITKKGSIYKATVTRREPSLDAVFVEYGSKRQGFLPFKEIAPEYYQGNPDDSGEGRPSLTSLIKEGQELLVQIDKEERGTKGAALTTFITLAGCYLVLMPNNPRSGGISRRIEGEERDELRNTLNSLDMPEDMGVIIRTAGMGKGQEELQDDLNMLLNQWEAIQNAWKNAMAPSLIHQEGDVIIRSIRDNLRKSIGEIVIDDHSAFAKARHYIEQVKPEFLPNLKLYKSHVPLFTFYQIESQIETAWEREVRLASGGALVIDRTEALVAIDINSAKATSGADIETTALKTNLEAAREIARQLRLRDLGGLIVIDFIDMGSSKHQREVEQALKEALKDDRARIQVGRISRFGLLEMSRQRLRLSPSETVQEVCPRCEGRGMVRNVQSHALSLLRLIEEEALKDKISEVHVQLPAEMATFLMNEKRDSVINIEQRHQVSILIITNTHMAMPQYSITRVREDNLGRQRKPSYHLVSEPEVRVIRADEVNESDEPAVKLLSQEAESQDSEQLGFIKRLWTSVFGLKPQSPSVKKQKDETEQSEKRRSEGQRQGGHQRSQQGNNQRRRRPQQNRQQGSSSQHQRRRPSGHSANQDQQRPRPVAKKQNEQVSEE